MGGLPNGPDGLSPNLDLAFPVTGDGSIDGQKENTRPVVEGKLRTQVRNSAGWKGAADVGWGGLPRGVPLPLAIIAKVAEQITGLDVDGWVASWFNNPVVNAINGLVQDALGAIFTVSVNIQNLFSNIDFLDPIQDAAEAAFKGFINAGKIIGEIAQAAVAGLVSALNTIGTNVSTLFGNFTTLLSNAAESTIAALGAAFNTAKNRAAEAFSNFTEILSGFSLPNIGSWITNLLGTRSTANNANTNASTALANATTALTDAAAAATTANRAEDRILTTTAANMVTDSSFANSQIWANAGGAMSALQAKSGVQSRMLTSTSGSYTTLFLLHGGNPVNAWAPCRPGERYRIGAWVFRDTANDNTGDFLLAAEFVDSTGVVANAYVNAYRSPVTEIPKGGWFWIEGNVTVPAGVNQFKPMVQLSDLMVTGNRYWVDDPVVREFSITQDTIQGLVTNLTGDAPAIWTQSDYDQAVSDLAATLAQQAEAISRLESADGGNNNSGNAATISFNHPDGSPVPSELTFTYYEPGTSSIGILNGGLQFVGATSDDRTAMFVYNALQTQTDYQKVGLVLTGRPYSFGSGHGTDIIRARCNASGTSYVYVEFWQGSYEIGYVVSGVKTVLFSTSFSTKASTLYWLEVGTAGGLRIFRVWEGSTLIRTISEVGTGSQVGAGFRYAGGGLTMDVYFGNHHKPGVIGAFGFFDNQPPNFVGSTFRAYRASGSTSPSANTTAGERQLPGSFYDTLDYRTSDFTWDPVNNRLTANITGTYLVTLSARCGATAGTFANGSLGLTLYKNNAVYQRSGGTNTGSGTGTTGTPSIAQDSFIVYLQAGDYVSPGWWNSASIAGAFNGESSGTQSFMSAALLNRSLA